MCRCILTSEKRRCELQECGGSSLAANTFSSFTIASLDVPLGARWTVNQVGSRHTDLTQHPDIWDVGRRG